MKTRIPLKRAKIVCTLGPSSDSEDLIKQLVAAGMDVARLNFSHGDHGYHRNLIRTIRKVSVMMEQPITILQDLQGPKIRVGTFENGEIELTNGSFFTLTIDDVIGNVDRVSVSYKSFNRDVNPGDSVLLDDGHLKLIVESVEGPDVRCRVQYGGILKDNKGLNLPGSILSVPCLTEKDRRDLAFGLDMEVDYIALSFVQKPSDIDEIKTIIKDFGKETPVVAKIEKPQAVDRIDEIIERTDAVMIARGDLGVEIPAEEVPQHQKDIIRRCNASGTPVITATQMLDSMIYNPRPTRAEASDVANAILDGTDAVMLSGETASGKYPLESVVTMNRIVELIEKNRSTPWELRRRKKGVVYSTERAIGYSACHAAELVNASAIICLTQSGYTAEMIARFRPTMSIIALTPKMKTYCRVPLVWGVTGMLTEEFGNNNDVVIEEIKQKLVEDAIVSPGDKLVFTGGLPFSERRSTNMLRIENV